VCDKIDLDGNGWMDWIEWMWMWRVESGCGKWKVARFRISHINRLRKLTHKHSSTHIASDASDGEEIST